MTSARGRSRPPWAELAAFCGCHRSQAFSRARPGSSARPTASMKRVSPVGSSEKVEAVNNAYGRFESDGPCRTIPAARLFADAAMTLRGTRDQLRERVRLLSEAPRGARLVPSTTHRARPSGYLKCRRRRRGNVVPRVVFARCCPPPRAKGVAGAEKESRSGRGLLRAPIDPKLRMYAFDLYLA